MRLADIQEGGVYTNAGSAQLFSAGRADCRIAGAAGWPRGHVVTWSTDTFLVQRCNRDTAGKTHGKCGIATFAKWATHRVDSTKQSA